VTKNFIEFCPRRHSVLTPSRNRDPKIFKSRILKFSGASFCCVCATLLTPQKFWILAKSRHILAMLPKSRHLFRLFGQLSESMILPGQTQRFDPIQKSRFSDLESWSQLSDGMILPGQTEHFDPIQKSRFSDLKPWSQLSQGMSCLARASVLTTIKKSRFQDLGFSDFLVNFLRA